MNQDVKNWPDERDQKKGAGRSSTSTTQDNIEQARKMVMEDKRCTINEIVSYLNISHSYAHQIIHGDIGFHKVSSFHK